MPPVESWAERREQDSPEVAVALPTVPTRDQTVLHAQGKHLSRLQDEPALLLMLEGEIILPERRLKSTMIADVAVLETQQAGSQSPRLNRRWKVRTEY